MQAYKRADRVSKVGRRSIRNHGSFRSASSSSTSSPATAASAACDRSRPARSATRARTVLATEVACAGFSIRANSWHDGLHVQTRGQCFDARLRHWYLLRFVDRWKRKLPCVAMPAILHACGVPVGVVQLTQFPRTYLPGGGVTAGRSGAGQSASGAGRSAQTTWTGLMVSDKRNIGRIVGLASLPKFRCWNVCAYC